MINKIISIEEVVSKIPDGATVMVGGFMGCGTPHKIIDALSKSCKKNLTVICNDGGMQGGPLGEERYGIAKLIHNRQVKKLIATHVGLNPEVATQSMQDKTLEVVLIPQGSLVEMIRAGGAGLGGILTPTGVGTVVEDNPFCLGKQTINERDYLLMAPLRADFALLSGNKIDTFGNIWYKGTTSNFNIVMGTAADTVIAEAEEVLPIGGIPNEDIRTSGVLVDFIVEGGCY